MMPLTDKTIAQEKSDEKISGALSTEEIVSLLNKSNKDFVKESDISSNITNLFKKIDKNIHIDKKINRYFFHRYVFFHR